MKKNMSNIFDIENFVLKLRELSGGPSLAGQSAAGDSHHWKVASAPPPNADGRASATQLVKQLKRTIFAREQILDFSMAHL